MRTFKLGLGPGGDVLENATVTKLVDIPEAGLLNGMATVNEETILVSDVHNGNVLRVNTVSGAYSIAIDDPKMKFSYVANPPINLGVNGIKIRDSHLHWANTAAGFNARIKINAFASPVGCSEIAVTNVPGADDFIIRSDGVAFICQNGEDTLSIAYLNPSEPVPAVPIAGRNTSTILAGVTAAAFGRLPTDRKRLYLSTSGGERNS